MQTLVSPAPSEARLLSTRRVPARSSTPRSYGGLALVLAVVASTTEARAQQVDDTIVPKGISSQGFDPAPAGDRFLATPDAAPRESNVFAVQALLNYARGPLRIEDTAAADPSLTADQLYLHAGASFSPTPRLLASVDVPFVLTQRGTQSSLFEPSGGHFGDVKLSARASAFGKENDSPVHLALQLDLWLPTGSPTNLTGEGSARFAPRALVGGRAGDFVYGAQFGAVMRHRFEYGPSAFGPSLLFGASAGWLFAGDRLLVGPEVHGSSVIPDKSSVGGLFNTYSTPVEALLGASFRAGPFVLRGGVGPGLTKAPSTAELRALLGLSFAPLDAPRRDADNDGIEDAKDACPARPGVASADPARRGCPASPGPDRDGDAIADAQDACPNDAGEASGDPKKNGCPADRDGDSVADARDVCPDEPGVPQDDPHKNGCPVDSDEDGIGDARDACPAVPGEASGDPKKNGCPADRDGDNVADAKDACPDVAGPESDDAARNGCPALAQIVGDEIHIAEQVHFETGKSRILPSSDPILEEVASILRARKDISLMTIEGHTDNVGVPNRNKTLSRQRADAVKAWLISRGAIVPKRLLATGWGEEHPRTSNDNEAGRAANRRVEFHLVKGEGAQASKEPSGERAQAPREPSSEGAKAPKEPSGEGTQAPKASSGEGAQANGLASSPPSH